jgi:hypothetical protein
MKAGQSGRVAVTALSAALSWGPAHAWGWLDEPVRVGVWAAAGMAVLLLMLPRRASAAVLLVTEDGAAMAAAATHRWGSGVRVV